jgi:hypothetical protein
MEGMRIFIAGNGVWNKKAEKMEETKPADAMDSPKALSSFWDLENFKPLVDYNKPDTELVQAQIQARDNPEFTFVCHLGESLGPYKGSLAGSVRLTRPANQSREEIGTAIEKFCAKMKKMIMSLYEDEPCIDSSESCEKYHGFEKAYDSTKWKRRVKGDQGVVYHMI